MKTLQQIIPKRKKINVIETRYEVTSMVDIRDKNTKSKSELTYDLDLAYIGGGLFKKWDKSNFRINGKYVFNKIDEIFLKVSEPLNKLDFFYEKGKITKLQNYKLILKDWEIVRENLIEEFYGEVINDLIEKTTENYNDLKLLQKLLSRDLVLQHLYSSTDIDDSLIYLKSSTNKRTFLGVLDNIPLSFIENKTLASFEDQLKIKTEANLKVEETSPQLIENYFRAKVDDFKIDDLQSTMKGEILFDPESLWINTASIEHDVKVENSDYKKTITLTIKRI